MNRTATAPLRVQEFLARLEHVRQRGHQWVARCPAHADGTPSLNIRVGDNGSPVVHCFAGCTYTQIMTAVGMKSAGSDRRDWVPPPRRREQQNPAGPPMSTADVCARVARIAHRERGGSGWSARSWVYRDRDGREILLVARADGPGEKLVRQCHRVNGGWCWGGPPEPADPRGWLRPLHDAELLAAPPGSCVFVVEGEKKADALRAIGLPATSLAGGSARAVIDRADLRPLAHLRTEILADHDSPGIAYALCLAVALVADPVRTETVRVLPHEVFGGGYPEGSDVADVIQRLRDQGLDDAEIAEQISIRVESAEALEVHR